MKALPLGFVFLLVFSGAGRILLDRFRLFADWTAGRVLFGTALGFGVAAYGVFFLGICGLLTFWPVVLWFVLLAIAGAKGLAANIRDVQTVFRAFVRLRCPVDIACLFVISLLFGFALLACFAPPTGLQWDSLSYHLADPKIFLQHGRISSLPTQHHSNFPFVMEMLYTVGLLFDGYALANIFHWLTGLLLTFALVAFGARHLSRRVGWFAGVLFITTPVIFWEAGTTYIELGLGLFVTLSAFAVLEGLRAKRNSGEALCWSVLAGVLMGFALGVKYLALLPFFFTALLLLFGSRNLKQTAAFVGAALLMASPWYVKNIVLTRNPVYPYLYSAFPQSKYWDAERAAAYQSEQGSFGYGKSLQNPAETLQNVLQTPWRLLANSDRYSNGGEYTFLALMGGFYAGLCFALFFLPRPPVILRRVLTLALGQLLVWFFLAQIGRYLTTLLPLFALAAAYAAVQLIRSAESRNRTVGRVVRGLVAGGIVGQTLLLLYGLFLLPTSGRVAMATGTMPTSFSVPEAVGLVGNPEAQSAMLSRTLDIYDAIQWINRTAAKGEGTVLYEETRGFLLDTPYLWGNYLHSSYIPYNDFADAAALTAWLKAHGIRFALVNLNGSPLADEDVLNGPLRGQEFAAVRLWYGERKKPTEAWRRTMNEAIKNGSWRPVFAEKGVVVLDMAEGSNPAERAGS